jgi:Superinfection immunity protein
MVTPLPAASLTNRGITALSVLIVLVSIAVYLVPTIIVLARHAPNVARVVVVNLLLGWTGIGWIVALVMALKRVPPRYPPLYLLPPGSPPDGPGR